ncbi:photosynthetic complex assembly protein PuhC [Telmatospirillum siberiense]|nr:photosynthetic complex assembly protein PuhC [Telmatospirillum siberiense]
MRSLNDHSFPPSALVGAGLLVFTTVVGVGIHQLKNHFQPPTAAASDAAPIEARQLRFIDVNDGLGAYGGHVRVFDARTGIELAQLAENEGFIRTVLNGLTFERTKRGIRAEPVFELAVWPDNKLTFGDPATGARVNLGQYGARNKSVFLHFLDHPEAGR